MWPQLAQFEYPGRFIMIGRTELSYYAIYGVTARSAASRAKRYIFHRDSNVINVEPTDIAIMSQGNLDLLSYDAVRLFNNAIVIGNGNQTNVITLHTSAAESLATSLQTQTFEPDKYNTPRISGMLLQQDGTISHALHIVKSDVAQQSQHELYDLQINAGQAYFISTYSGENMKPTPSFNGAPILLTIDFKNAQDAAQQVYDYFTPGQNKPDLRVSVMAIESDLQLAEKTIAIINFAK